MSSIDKAYQTTLEASSQTFLSRAADRLRRLTPSRPVQIGLTALAVAGAAYMLYKSYPLVQQPDSPPSIAQIRALPPSPSAVSSAPSAMQASLSPSPAGHSAIEDDSEAPGREDDPSSIPDSTSSITTPSSYLSPISFNPTEPVEFMDSMSLRIRICSLDNYETLYDEAVAIETTAKPTLQDYDGSEDDKEGIEKLLSHAIQLTKIINSKIRTDTASNRRLGEEDSFYAQSALQLLTGSHIGRLSRLASLFRFPTSEIERSLDLLQAPHSTERAPSAEESLVRVEQMKAFEEARCIDAFVLDLTRRSPPLTQDTFIQQCQEIQTQIRPIERITSNETYIAPNREEVLEIVKRVDSTLTDYGTRHR